MISMSRKNETKKNFNGLTVNERLHLAGLLKRFDAAARRRNRVKMMTLLKQVALPESYAAKWVDAMLGDQTFFYH
jgi:hypothetical protein